MSCEQIPQNEYCLVQLPVYLKSEKNMERVVGEKQEFISAVKQGSSIPISVFPENPLMGTSDMHSKPSNKLILKVVKEGDSVSGQIIGRVKNEYESTELLDFSFLPEKQFYTIQQDGVIPHLDMFEKNKDSQGLYGLPIRFTTYTSPFDINMHDSSNEKERTQMKDHIFVSSIAETPTHPREGLAPIPPNSLSQRVFDYFSELLQNQPIWDKRYLYLNIRSKFVEENEQSVKSALQTVAPHLCYVMTDGPFRNVWIRFGYNPSKHQESWIYQYVEFRFSKKPQLKNPADFSSKHELPELYNIPLNLHNRYPFSILQTDREMQLLISQIHPLTEYDKRNGWISPDITSGIRNLLKKQAVLLLDKQGYDTNTALFSMVKRRIQSSGGNYDSTRKHRDKTLDPSFNGSTEQLMKEMPLELYEEATQNENDGDYMSDEGFQVFGDNDGVIEL